MIKYPEGLFGFHILFRFHGSALAKSVMPALTSSAIYIILFHTTDLTTNQILDHPYAMGALIAAFTFLLSFRANFAYNRYWEAFTAVHQMHSKWLDVGVDMAAFHLQAHRYDSIKPPCFGKYPHLTSLVRERSRLNEPTREEVEKQIDETIEKELEARCSTSRFSRWRLLKRRRKQRTNENNSDNPQHTSGGKLPTPVKTAAVFENRIKQTKKNINAPAKSKNDKKPTRSMPFDILANSTKKPRRGHRRVVSSVPEDVVQAHLDPNIIDKRPLFLQETAHLLSLLSAVSLSTLRNDAEYAESPLIPFMEGAPFPSVDPDDEGAVREDWGSPSQNTWFRKLRPTLRFLFGFSRNEYSSALYNAARPFRVIGGISDNEVMLLQAARGPQAKVNLVNLWIQEFITREYLSGSTGDVAPPIISRLYQFLSDGNLGYNQARKVAYIPFPFPHAQITCLFVIIIMIFIPIMMLTYLNREGFGFVMNLLTVMCFAGLHEVSRELENPFLNAPNDLPCNNFQAQFNEALMASLFSGYHPDAYWEIKEAILPDESESSQPPMPDNTNMMDIVAQLNESDVVRKAGDENLPHPLHSKTTEPRIAEELAGPFDTIAMEEMTAPSSGDVI